MAMMAARGLHLNGLSMPSHASALNSYLGKSRASLMPSKKASSVAHLDLKQPTLSTLPKSAPQAPPRTVSKAAASSDAFDNKENVDPLSFLRSQFRFQVPSTPNTMYANGQAAHAGMKRKYEADVSSTRVPLRDITAQVLERDYKVKMTGRQQVTRVASAYPEQPLGRTSFAFTSGAMSAAPFQFSLATAKATERPMKTPIVLLFLTFLAALTKD